MLYDIPCFRAACCGEPDCGDWLRGAIEDPPNHVCYDIARASVEMFATQWCIMTCPLDGCYHSGWPLPAGYQAMAEWAQEHGKQGKAKLPPTWFAHPLLEEPTALIGLAAVRRRAAGSLWFFGLVERLWPEQPPADANSEALRNHLEALRWANEVRIYRFSGGALRIEGDYTALREDADVLTRWYANTVLGTTVKGRPPGSGTFASREEFHAVLTSVIEGLKAQGHQPTQSNVADYFANHEGFQNCDERQLRRWTKRFGFADWQTLIGGLDDN